MDSSAADGLAAFSVLIFGFGLILTVLWILVPFAVFGIKGRLDRLIGEQRRTNELLQYLAKDAEYRAQNGR